MTRTSTKVLLYVPLGLAAIGFLFPFYFMIVGAPQENPTSTPSALVPSGGWTLGNFTTINERVDLVRTLFNSLVYTAGVLVGTLVFGLCAGYALARPRFRGRRVLFSVMPLVQMIPFQPP